MLSSQLLFAIYEFVGNCTVKYAPIMKGPIASANTNRLATSLQILITQHQKPVEQPVLWRNKGQGTRDCE